MAANRQPFAAALPCCGAPVFLDATSRSATSALERDEKGPPRHRGGFDNRLAIVIALHLACDEQAPMLLRHVYSHVRAGPPTAARLRAAPC